MRLYTRYLEQYLKYGEQNCHDKKFYAVLVVILNFYPTVQQNCCNHHCNHKNRYPDVNDHADGIGLKVGR